MRRINGWRILFHQAFAAQFERLVREVEAIGRRAPDRVAQHPKTKLVAALHQCITERVPADPTAREFLLGHSLGPGFAHWRRVKHGLPRRYRLFFRFLTRPEKLIVFVWLNDDATLRKAGARSDVYAVFAAMLAKGAVPDDMSALIERAREAPGFDE
jgi:toxin YhaV